MGFNRLEIFDMAGIVKFRAWHQKSKTMLSHNGDFTMTLDDTDKATIEMWSGDGLVDTWKTDKLMHFTGLKDRNDVELYEGDIINVSGHLSAIQCERYLSFYFWCEPMKEFSSLAFLTGYKNFEIVGNIYENPELLPEE